MDLGMNNVGTIYFGTNLIVNSNHVSTGFPRNDPAAKRQRRRAFSAGVSTAPNKPRTTKGVTGADGAVAGGGTVAAGAGCGGTGCVVGTCGGGGGGGTAAGGKKIWNSRGGDFGNDVELMPAAITAMTTSE